MDEMIINLGADNSKLLNVLNQSQTSVDRFLDSSTIKELSKLKINIDKANFDKVLSDYSKRVTKELGNLKKAFSISIKNGENGTSSISIIPEGGIKDVLSLNNALQLLKKYRDKALGGTTDIDNYIRKFELAKNAINNLNKYLNVNEKAGTSLMQSMMRIQSLTDMRGKIGGASSLNELQKQLDLQKQIHREYQQMNKITANKGYRSEVSMAYGEMKSLQEQINLMNKLKSTSDARTYISNMSKSVSLETDESKKLEMLRKIKVAYEKIRSIQGGTLNKVDTSNLRSTESEINRITSAIKRRNEEARKGNAFLENIDKKQNRISILTDEYKKTPNNNLEERISLLKEIIKLQKELNRIDQSLAGDLQSNKINLAEEKKKLEEQRIANSINKKENIISGYNNALSSSSDDKERLLLLNKIKREWESIQRLQGGSLTRNQITEYRRISDEITRITNSIREQTRANQTNRIERERISNLEREISQRERSSVRTGDASDLGAMRNKRRELLQLINNYEKLHRLQRKNGIQVDTTSYSRAIQDLRNLENQMRRINSSSFQLRSTLGHLFGGYQMANFARQIAETTGYFQAQKVAMESILQDAGAAQKIFNQLKDFSLKTPFEFKDLLTQTKQLSAFQVPTEELFETTKRLGDLSAGLGVDMNRLILAYGQVKSAAFLRGQEVRQFTEAGVPLVQALADKFTVLEGRVVSAGEVFERISKRMVSFEMVKDVLWELTDETGKFYNMQETISGTVQGRILNLKDAWNQAIESIGSSNLGLINGVLKTLSSILENINFWLWSIIGIGFAYFINRSSKAINKFALSIKSASFSLKSFGKVIKSISFSGWMTIITLIGSAIAGLVSNINAKKNELKKSLGEIADSFDKETKKLIKNFNKLANDAVSSVDGTEKQIKAIEQLKTQYKDYIPLLDLEIDKIRAMRGEYDLLTQAIENAQEAKKIQAQKEEVYSEANKHYFGEDNEFSKIFNKSDVLIDLGGGRGTSYFGDNKTLIKQVEEDLSASFSKLLEKGEPITLKSLYDAAQEVSDLYIRDAYYYKRVSEVSRKSAKALFDDMSSSEYSKTLADIYRREGRVNPLKKVLDEKTQAYEESLKNLTVQGKTSEQIKKDKDLLSMGLMFEQIGIVQKELYNSLNQARPNLTNDEYNEYLKRINDNAEFFNNIRDAYIEVLNNNDKTTSADDDVENLYSLVSTYTSKLKNVDKILSGTFFNLNNIFGTFLDNVGWLYDWQRDVNSYIDKYGDDELKNFYFSSNKINEDGTNKREEFEKKIQKEYDKAKSELEKYEDLNSNKYSKEELDAIKKGYEDKILHMKELAKIINYDIDKQKDGGGSSRDYVSDYSKRLSAFQAFIKKYTELLKTYTHEKAIEILKGDTDGLISQFVTTDAEKKASRKVSDKKDTNYLAGFGGFVGWNEEAFIKNSEVLKSQIKAVTEAEIKRVEALLKSGRVSKSAINELNSISRELSNIGIDSIEIQLERLRKLAERIEESENETKSFFNSLISLGVSVEDAASLSTSTLKIDDLYGYEIGIKKEKISKLIKSYGITDDFNLDYTQETEGAISEIEKLKTNIGDNASIEQTVAIDNIIKELKELLKLQRSRMLDMKEIVLKYSIVAQKQARENEAEKQKAINNETTMDSAVDLLDIPKESLGNVDKLMKDIYNNLNAIDFKTQIENDKAFIQNYDEQMKYFFGDFGNVSGKMISELQESAKSLREELEKTGKLTPQLTEYFDKLDISIINASKGVKSFFDNLSMKDVSRKSTADSMVTMIDALSKLGTDYSSASKDAKASFGVDDAKYKSAKERLSKSESDLNTLMSSIASFAYQNYKDPTTLITLVQGIYNAITSGNINGIAKAMDDAKSYAGKTKNVSYNDQNSDKRLAKLRKAKSDLNSVNEVVSAGQSVIDSFGQAFSAVGDIVSAFGDKTEDATEAFEEIQYFMDDLSSAYGAISPMIGLMTSLISLSEALAAAGIACQLSWGWILLIVAAAAGLVAGVMYAFKKHDRDLEKQIEERKRSVEELQNKLKQLDWERDISGNPFKNAEERLRNMSSTIEENKAILDMERNKKKQDLDAIQDAEEELAQSERDRFDAWLELRDELIGSVSDVSNSLGDAFFEAFANGENAARAMGNSIKEIIGNAIKNALITQFLMPKVEKLFKDVFGEPSDNGYTGTELLDPDKVKEFSDKAKALTVEFTDGVNNLDDYLKGFLTQTGDNTLTSGIDGVTEETASIIASYMNSVRDALLIQSGYVKDISVSVLSINDNYLPNIQTHLLNIDNNTSTINSNMENMLNQVLAMINGSKSLKVKVI